MGSPSPPPMLPPPPPIPHPPPSSIYVNEEVLTSAAIELEHNNNKSVKRTMQRSCTVSSTTSSSGFMASEPTPLPGMHTSQETSCKNRPPPLPMASYINVDLSSDASPLSPSHSISESTPLREEACEIEGAGHAYMNISPGQENSETGNGKARPSLAQVQTDWDEDSRHCYANLESSDIEVLRKRFSGISAAEKSPLPTTPPAAPVREVNYAILDLDQKNCPVVQSPEGSVNSANSLVPPDSPNKPLKGYATIDFNKTTALSHSVNPNLVNDNEGSRKTRHNSTINDLAAPSRHSSSISE